jgi:hypothetical protein
MSDVAGAPAEGASLSVAEAAGLLGRPKPQETQEAAPVTESAPQTESEPVEGNDAELPQESPGEATEAEDEAGEPPVDPPRSWPKAEKEVFKALPRESQLKLAEIEKARDREVQKGLQANAEREKALEAEKAAAQQARQNYETALPQIQQSLNGTLEKRFSDIKSWDDVQKLRVENPARYLEWDALVKQSQAVKAELDQAQTRKKADHEKWVTNFTKAEDAKFLEHVPDYADPVKAAKLQGEALDTLKDIGFSDDELDDYWQARKPLLARDHRVQRLIHEAAQYRAAKRAAVAAKAKPQTPVTRPGVAPAKGEAKAAAVQELQQKLVRTGNVSDAVALLKARRAK